MHAFISKLEATTTQVHAMAGTVGTATGGTAPLTLPMSMYEEHMLNIHKHPSIIDTEHATAAADQEHIQAI